jgi:formylglycine-generating enzyme required for sulfatase activity
VSQAGLKALVELLQALFSADELRRFVALLPGEHLAPALPSGSASLATLAFELVDVLGRHGLLDRSFFELLENERPARRDEITEVRSLLMGSMTSARPAALPSVPGHGRTTPRPLDPLAEKLEHALARKRRLEDAGQPTDDILAELRALKREHRRGGQLRRGDALGERYLLIEQIGRGGFATVWRARDSASGDDMAIKVLHPELAGDAVRRQRFFRGARIMTELAHPIVVRIREREAEDDGFFYFVMELVTGGNLQDAVLARRVQREQAMPIILGIGEALAQAHARGHVHRDVKPVNILLTESGEPRLTDFDLVTGQDTTGGTRTGALGTFIYAAPEMMDRPQDADARADVYGLGMTIAFMLHGDRLPRKALTARERFIEELGCPPALAAVLKQATAEDPADRHLDAAAFCEALRAATSPGSPPVESELDENAAESVEDGLEGLQFLASAMVELPGGTFWMGSSDDDEMADDNEKPLHQVKISPFWCMKFPVTRRLWRDVMGGASDWWPKGPADNRPVNRVSWFDAVIFCNVVSQRAGLKPCYRIDGETVEWVSSEGYRLPTEAEWEYACRAGSQTRWCFGDDESKLGEYAWYNANADAPQPVARKQANAWGLHDMHGNVWEWCWDWEAAYPNLSSVYAIVDPPGPRLGTLRVLRGGSFKYKAGHVRCADRLANWPGDRGRNWGFRCVRSAELPEQLSSTAVMAGSDSLDIMEPAQNEVTAVEVLGEPFVEPTTGLRFLWVPGGRFWMGSGADEEDAFEDEKPRHLVEVSGYWLAETPVTNRQYEIFVREQPGTSGPRWWRDRKYNQPEQPVVGVTWLEAKAFCRWLSALSGRRLELPTEAQWEFAARGPEGRRYPWGDEAPDGTRAHYGRSLEEEPIPVGSLPAGHGPFGHMDLAGNIWEWCRDAWDRQAYAKRGALTVDPEGPRAKEGDPNVARACRGGAAFVEPRSLRAAYRFRLQAAFGYQGLGFRVAALPARR